MSDPMLEGILSDRLSETIGCLGWLVDEAKREQSARDGQSWQDWHYRSVLLEQALVELQAWQEEIKD